MATGELENPFAAKRVFKRLLAYGTFAANKRPLASSATSIGIQHPSHLGTDSLGPLVVGGAALALSGWCRFDRG